MIVGAYVTAYARIEMDKAFQKILTKDSVLLYTDTDSVLVKLRKGKKLALPEGSSYREWKNELPKNSKIIDYYALGPKSYSYRYQVNDEVFSSIKCKGFCLKRKQDLDHNDINAMVKRRKRGEMSKKTIPQFRLNINKKSRKMNNTYFFKSLSSDILKKRSLQENSNVTMPFGFTQKLLNRVNC